MGREKSPPPTTKGEGQSEASKIAQRKLESDWYKHHHHLSRVYKKARRDADSSLSHNTSKTNGGRKRSRKHSRKHSRKRSRKHSRKHSRKAAFTKKK